jgi:hypothetical protein
MAGAPTLIKAILAAAGFVGIFVEQTQYSYFGFCLFAITALPLCGVVTYTKISLYVTLLVAFQEWISPPSGGPLPPFLFVNFAAVSVSFHTARIMDQTVFERVASRSCWTLTGFHVRNFMVHILPTAMLYAWLRLRPNQYKVKVPAGPSIGVLTAAVHLLWAYINFGTLDLSDTYVELPPSSWNVMWSVAIATHVVMGCAWNNLV